MPTRLVQPHGLALVGLDGLRTQLFTGVQDGVLLGVQIAARLDQIEIQKDLQGVADLVGGDSGLQQISQSLDVAPERVDGNQLPTTATYHFPK